MIAAFQPMGPIESWGTILLFVFIIGLTAWAMWPQPRKSDSPGEVPPTGLVKAYRPPWDWAADDSIFDGDFGMWVDPWRERRAIAELHENRGLWPHPRSLNLRWSGIQMILGSRYAKDSWI